MHGQLSIGYRSYGNQTWPIKWNAVSSRQLSYRYCCMDALHDANKTAGEETSGNYTRMLRAILNKSWRQHPQDTTIRPPASHHETIQARRNRHAGHCRRSRDELISDVLLWTPTYGRQKLDDQHEHTFSSYVRIRDVAQKTCRRDERLGEVAREGQGYPS